MMLSSSDLTYRSFSLCTISVLLIWMVVIVLGEIDTKQPAGTLLEKKTSWRFSNARTERKNERNCKALCEHCGCLGFYCGEECICECNNDDSDTECIGTMQSNARQLEIPFEILIQGPSSNRFLRKALQFEQNADRRCCAATRSSRSSKVVENTARSKRSTVTIYKPQVLAALPKQSSKSNALLGSFMSKKEMLTASRQKRSVERQQMDWFNELTSNFVRPAPLVRHRSKKVTEAPKHIKQEKRVDKLDTTWFMEPNVQHLVRPAPLKKRQQAEKPKTKQRAMENVKSTMEQALQVVESIPRILQDTLNSGVGSNIKDSKNYIETNRLNFLSSADMLPDPLPKNDFTDTLRKMSQEVLGGRDVLATNAWTPSPMPASGVIKPIQPPRRILMPWLRNRRFLRRDRLQQLHEANKNSYY